MQVKFCKLLSFLQVYHQTLKHSVVPATVQVRKDRQVWMLLTRVNSCCLYYAPYV